MMIGQFLNYLRYERNASPRTVRLYGESLHDFESYFKDKDSQLSWASVDADIIRDWMESMMDRGVMASTVNTRLSAVRSFFRFALSRGLVESDPSHALKGPKRQKPLPQFVRESEMDELLDFSDWSPTIYKEVCARTILVLFYETGMRCSELTGLNDTDVDYVNHQLKVTGKRDKQRLIPFGSEVERTLRDYQQRRDEEVRREDAGALFLSEKGRRLTYYQVYTCVRKYLSLVTTIKKRSPHVLRHTFATAMLNNGAGLESVRKLLGHESVATTEIYTHTTFDQLKRVYKDAHPRA
ncbi:MAG: tyrosine-type recombinase/integrase [Prevotella sp.]|nr:tyrosine-type recombinase/integrase [Prevotella sp.]